MLFLKRLSIVQIESLPLMKSKDTKDTVRKKQETMLETYLGIIGLLSI